MNPSTSPIRGTVPLSVLIPSKDEERNIADCLRSVSWADERVIIDSASKDRTREIAEGLGATVVPFSWSPGTPKKKNWALTNYPFKNDWILILDADERITPRLAAEIQQAINVEEVSGYYLNRRFYFLGKWIRHAGYFPSWNLRLFRRHSAHYEFIPDNSSETGDNEVHEHVILKGSSGWLQEPMEHFAYPNIQTFLEKHNRYSTWEASCCTSVEPLENGTQPSRFTALVNAKRASRRIARLLPFPHWARFLYHYLIQRGFLDGRAGYFFCHLLAEYEFQIWAKRYELSLSLPPPNSRPNPRPRDDEALHAGTSR